jgi:ribosome-binding ATPase
VVHVVRCFENPDIVHVDGTVDPLRDLDTIHVELCLADADSLGRRLERLRKSFKQGDKKLGAELAVFEKILPLVESGAVVDLKSYPEEELQILRKSQLLSTKPVIYAANVNEDELADPDKNPHVRRLKEHALKENREVVVISAQIEAELSQLEAEEKKEYLASLGVESSGVDQLIAAAFRTLGMLTYFTAGVQEARAWPFTRGMTAPQCAGIIHSDFEKGFIRAEVIAYDDYVACGGEKGAKDKGLMRLEGKEYLMKDGDVVHFRFNV